WTTPTTRPRWPTPRTARRSPKPWSTASPPTSRAEPAGVDQDGPARPSGQAGTMVCMTSSLDRVRHVFDQVGYTVAGVRELLGPVAGGALARDQVVPALRATHGSQLGAITRLFWIQVPVAERSLPAGLSADLVEAGLAERAAGELRALLHVEPLE